MSQVSFKEAAEEYWTWFCAHRKSILTTQYVIKSLLVEFAGCTIGDLTFERIQQWFLSLPKDRRHSRAARSSANRDLTVLRGILNYATKMYAIESTPWMEVERYKLEQLTARYLTKSEVARLLNVCEVNFRNLVHAAALTGARYGELARLEKKDLLELPSSEFCLLIQESKTGTARTIYINDEAASLFRDLRSRGVGDLLFLRPSGKPWVRGNQVQRMKRASQKAEISPKAHFHMLRHTFAAHFLMAGGSLEALRRQLGHRSIRTTADTYSHLDGTWREKNAKRYNPSYLEPAEDASGDA